MRIYDDESGELICSSFPRYGTKKGRPQLRGPSCLTPGLRLAVECAAQQAGSSAPPRSAPA